MAVQAGLENLPGLLSIVLLVMLIANPIHSYFAFNYEQKTDGTTYRQPEDDCWTNSCDYLFTDYNLFCGGGFGLKS